MEEVLYVCGDSLSAIECDDTPVLNVIYTRSNLSCSSPIEIPYFSAGHSPLCFFYGSEDVSDQANYYPTCRVCTQNGQHPVARRKRASYKPKN